MKKAKTLITDYSVADALSNGVSDLESLKDELQDWYDNMPENFQSGDKGEQLQTAIDQLDSACAVTIPEGLDGETDSDDKPTLGGVRFLFAASTKKRMSRADRCSEATALMRSALDAVKEELEPKLSALNNVEDLTDEQQAELDALETLNDGLGEIEQAIDDAEAVEFPGMMG